MKVAPRKVVEQDIDVLVWDLETTGFVAPAAKVIEIGALAIKDGVVLEEHHYVLDNACEIPEKITEITGITAEIIAADGKDPKECLSTFLPLFRRAKVNVTHNGVRFDIPFLTAYAADLFGYTPEQEHAMLTLLRTTAFDTAVHFKASQLGMYKHPAEQFAYFADRVMNVRAKGVFFNLAGCIDEIGFDRSSIVTHRALGDVQLTHELYKHITSLP